MKNKPDWNEKLDLPQSEVDNIDNAIMELVMTGMVEMSIGEDGEIYLSITPEGREYADNLEEFQEAPFGGRGENRKSSNHKGLGLKINPFSPR